jgi:16S rRNA (guanine(966)-N(2))-methyltransferase RsmD
MRIIAGKYKGRHLFAAKNRSIRPTTDRVKEYIFSILEDYIKDCRVLDLFAGTGSLGLESLSRGANNVAFVENSFQSIKVLKKNLFRIKVQEPYSIIQKNTLTFFRGVIILSCCH